MTSKTRMLALVKAHDWDTVERAVAESPALLGVRDERGRGWLHIACATPATSDAGVAASIRTADVLIAAGLGVSDAAFTEGDWRATPLWCAVGRGRNLALAEHLLQLGCDPEHCLWAAQAAQAPAAVRRHYAPAAMRLLVRYGAQVDASHPDGTPFMGAVKWSQFENAQVLLELGANPDVKDSNGMTALHLMLKKGSDAAHLAMLIRHGAGGDIPGPDGRTAIQLLERKQDPALRRLAAEFAARR